MSFDKGVLEPRVSRAPNTNIYHENKGNYYWISSCMSTIYIEGENFVTKLVVAIATTSTK